MLDTALLSHLYPLVPLVKASMEASIFKSQVVHRAKRILGTTQHRHYRHYRPLTHRRRPSSHLHTKLKTLHSNHNSVLDTLLNPLPLVTRPTLCLISRRLSITEDHLQVGNRPGSIRHHRCRSNCSSIRRHNSRLQNHRHCQICSTRPSL